MKKAAQKPIEVEASTKGFAITYGWEKIEGAHPFIGAHYFMRVRKARGTPMSVALFPTHRMAADALKIAIKKNPNAKVVPVDIFVKRSQE